MNFSQIWMQIKQFSHKKMNLVMLSAAILYQPPSVNTLRLRQNGRRFADNIFKCIFLNENVSILIKISLKFVPKGPINNIPALVQIMAWHRPGDKPLSESMMVSLPMQICITRPHWVENYMIFWLLSETETKMISICAAAEVDGNLGF